jgi:thiol-disulfide isomerase/thioredoxin
MRRPPIDFGEKMNETKSNNRRQFLRSATATAIAGSQITLARAMGASFFSEGSLPSLDGATAWLNSPPLKKTDLLGKVALIDFWTYTCINWRRTLPYIRAWDAKYRKHGLTVIGVHTPEFPFEKNAENVRQALLEMKIDYPVAIDSDYAVWRAFENEYWPAIYLADAQGHIHYHKFGEGDYEQSEKEIQRLLKQAGASIESESISINPTDAEVAADWADLRSQENYVGYERTEGFASPNRTAFDKPHVYSLPQRLSLNEWALAGNWTTQKDAIALNAANGRIAYQFHARDLHLVMGLTVRGTSIRYRVTLDGRPPGAAHGTDVDEQGNGIVAEQRLYQLIRQPKPIGDRTFEIEFLDAGAEAFSFTFG